MISATMTTHTTIAYPTNSIFILQQPPQNPRIVIIIINRPLTMKAIPKVPRRSEMLKELRSTLPNPELFKLSCKLVRTG